MRILLLILLPLWTGFASARADLLDDAVEAHRTGIPEVSITKLRQFLASQPPADRAEAAKLLLARCLIETKKAKEATEILGNAVGPEAIFLKAQEALRSGRWQEAAGWFGKLAATPGQFSAEARLGLADSQKALGELEAALKTLQPLIANDGTADPRAQLLATEIYLGKSNISEAKTLLARVKASSRRMELEKLCLAGELALKEGKMAEATDAFNKVLAEPEDRTLRMVSAARLGLAKVLIQKQEYEEAENELEKLISDEPGSPVLSDLFANLFEIYSKENNPSTSELARWAADNPSSSGPNRPAYALYYLLRLQLRLGLITQAVQSYRALVERFPNHPVTVEACLILSRQQLEAGNFDEAIKQLESLLQRSPDLPAADQFRVSYLLGETYYRKGNLSGARDKFLSLSRTFDYNRRNTLFNLAICSLRLGDAPGFEQAFRELEQSQPNDHLVGDLLFAKGLLEAKSGNALADETLQTLLQKYPNHPQADQTRLLQAEVRLMEQPHNLSGARLALREVSSGITDPALAERAERLKFFALAADPSQNVRSVQALAQEYLQKFPDSPSKAEVRLKLGELYYRENDFPNAQTQFELVREESPDSPLVESALFLAAEAARKSLNSASVDRAISLFEDVYKLGGSLKFQARLEQAMTMRQTKQEKEAVVLLDDLLTQNPPSDIRYQALDGKGEAQFTLAANEPKFYEEAIKTFDTLISSDGLPPEWKQRAIYQKGKCFEKLGKMDDALSNYYDVLAVEGGGTDQLWFFRAGFDSAQILEGRQSWRSAAAIYDKLANTRGARSEEAKSQLARLRLEHFLWPE
jgi:TolA-binding protein